MLNQSELKTWLLARLPADLLAIPPEIRPYDDEIVIVLHGAGVELADDVDDDLRRQSEQRRIVERREETRHLRMQLARELQRALGRPVAWGMRIGQSEALFTTRSAPVMTRLGRAERDVLDTLVAAGVAETRSSALAYVVRVFAAEHSDWLADVRQAITQIDQVRARFKLTRRGTPAAEAEREGE